MHFDIATHTFFKAEQNTFLTAVMKTISFFFDTIPFLIMLVVLLYFLHRKNWHIGVRFLMITTLMTFIVTWLLKYISGVARPAGGIISAFGPSFPSAHAAIATSFFLSIAYIIRRDIGKKQYLNFLPFAIVGTILVGISRIYLGVHWLSDVIVGYFVGAICVYFVIWLTKKYD